MRTFDQWMTEYSVSHQNPTNKMIHNICIPVIFFTVVALLWKLSIFLFIPVALAAIAFYWTMGKKVAILGAVMIGLALVLQLALGFGYIMLILLFAAAWAGQFYGHKIEGQKPSFLEDLMFLFIGPLWVAYPTLQKAGFTVEN
ncbi:DUF962 domain-containing protein [Leucothrix pacifica]|uniref:DUF962 domain-containing protein n=1 Tax=Leucothrix pacifica TaxID=1247513 RepID=A0A317CMI2_9GAMM|nr:Mpo1-like protein [Leucothrix pacifica]PWQ99748.1 hypothetical protein DKW60_04535 [Leucothrix pacifica]